ncbi:tRNA (adenosine(37)-N6)-dimethylallyltransferase MiaA [Bacteroidota bacterium]
MKKVLAIVGPTASGKTKLSIEVAKDLDAEIISADSRQVFKHIPIASAIPSVKERQGIVHHFLEEYNLNEEFNAGKFGILGRKRIDEIFSRGKTPLIVGGSGLYLKSLIDGFYEEEISSKEIRKQLYDKLKLKGKEFLYNELKEIDKIAASRMIPQNVRRVIRALEIYYTSGKKISDLQKKTVKIDFVTLQVGLMLDRKYLYKRINERVDDMIKKGLIDEVQKLKDTGFNYINYNSLNTVGIKEVFQYLAGELNYTEMVDLIKQNSRRYAKRQITWFRNDDRIRWIEVKEKDRIEVLRNEICNLFKNF